MNFLDIFEPLYSARDGALRTSLLDGSLAGLRFFSHSILPLVKAQRSDDQLTVARIARSMSPLLSKESLKAAGDKQAVQVGKARDAIADLMRLWDNGSAPRLVDVLRSVARTSLFEIPESLRPTALRETAEQPESTPRAEGEGEGEGEDADEILAAWDKSLLAPFSQIDSYASYVAGTAPFGTHQGVKGLEFPRVLVIMDDAAAGGFLFKYDKLFGAEAKSATDLERERKGEDSGIDRTRRLLYVTCSRSQKSLALVAYSTNPAQVRERVIREGWLQESEIEAVS